MSDELSWNGQATDRDSEWLPWQALLPSLLLSRRIRNGFVSFVFDSESRFRAFH